ncbi:hypothetical protein E2C01_020726 [Portunus trituberculatus]|uniref:Uncharacterized protein n=1 Tax=Portunus trituberculatus TaxID=210409 RepID=A0A5B7E2V6_PORTR|nr:hypothetical protein [Portunus trituberculatus]
MFVLICDGFLKSELVAVVTAIPGSHRNVSAPSTSHCLLQVWEAAFLYHTTREINDTPFCSDMIHKEGKGSHDGPSIMTFKYFMSTIKVKQDWQCCLYWLEK